MLICALSALGFFVMSSPRHFILPFCAFIYQISVKYAPGMPSYSDFNFSGARGVAVALSLLLLLSSLVAFSVRARLFSGKCLRRVPLLVPSLLMGVALLLNGALSDGWSVAGLVYGGAVALSWFFVFYFFYFGFAGEDTEELVSYFILVSALMAVTLLLNGALSDGWSVEGLVYGAAVATSWFFVFYFFYFGFEGEDTEELVSYFVLVSALMAAILIAQTAHLYLFCGVVGADGAVDKEAILYGWGIWTTAGVELAVLIPTILLGAMRGWRPYLFLALAALSLVAIALNLSRGALLVGIFAFAAGMVAGALFGEGRRAFRRMGALGGATAAVAIALLWERIRELLRDYFERGLSDNGRFALWRYGWESFIDAPLLGKGFFGLRTDTFQAIELIPQMLHNTPVQIAASMGALGLLAYFYYRVKSLRAVLCRPTKEKLMLGLSMLALLASSLFDNFIFYIQPMFYYSVTFALICRLSDGQNGAE